MLKYRKNISIFISILLISLLFFSSSILYSLPQDTSLEEKASSPSPVYTPKFETSEISLETTEDSLLTPFSPVPSSSSHVDIIENDIDLSSVLDELESDNGIVDLYEEDVSRKQQLNQKEIEAVVRFFDGLQRHFSRILREYNINTAKPSLDPSESYEIIPDFQSIFQSSTLSYSSIDQDTTHKLLEIIQRERRLIERRANLKHDIKDGTLNGLRKLNNEIYKVNLYYIESASRSESRVLLSIRLASSQNSAQLSRVSYNVLLSTENGEYENKIEILNAIRRINAALSFDKELIDTLIENKNISPALLLELQDILERIYHLQDEISLIERNTMYFMSEDTKQISNGLNKILNNLKTLNSYDIINLAYNPSSNALAVLSTDPAPRWGSWSYLKQRISGAMAPPEFIVGLVSVVFQSSLTFLAVLLKYYFTPELNGVDKVYVYQIGYVYSLWSAVFAFVIGSYGVTYKNLMDRISENYSSESGRIERIIKEVIVSLAFAVPLALFLAGCDDGTGHINPGITLGWILNFVIVTSLVKLSKDLVFAYFRQIRKINPQSSTEIIEKNSLIKFSFFNLKYQMMYNILSFFPKIMGLIGARFGYLNIGNTLIVTISMFALVFNKLWSRSLYYRALEGHLTAVLSSKDFDTYGKFSEYIVQVITSKEPFNESIIDEKFNLEAVRSNLKDVENIKHKFRYFYYWFSSSNNIQKRLLLNEENYSDIIAKIIALSKKIDRIYSETHNINDVQADIQQLIKYIILYDTYLARDEYLKNIKEDIEQKGNVTDRVVDVVRSVKSSVYSCITYFTASHDNN